MDIKDIVTIAEAAALLGISPQAVGKAVKHKQLAALRETRPILIARIEVEAYRQRTQPDGVKAKGRPKKQENAQEPT